MLCCKGILTTNLKWKTEVSYWDSDPYLNLDSTCLPYSQVLAQHRTSTKHLEPGGSHMA